MAYTGKTGLDYFPFEVNFFDDDKIELIEGEFGSKGVVITVKLLCKIYKEGYFYRWGDDECLLFSKRAGSGIVPQLVDEVVKGLLRRSFFDKTVFDQFKILTSRGIQYRYLEAAERRKSVHIHANYLLTDLTKFKNVYIVDQNDNILSKDEYILRQRKVKESKGKESNCDASENVHIPPDGESPPPDKPPDNYDQLPKGFFPGNNELGILLPDIRIGANIERIRLMKRIDVDSEQITGLWEVFKIEHFTGKKNYQDFDGIYQHFGNWLKDQKFEQKRKSDEKEQPRLPSAKQILSKYD